MGVATPPQLTEAFATSGTANTIPVASQIGVTPGAASFTDGFPPLTATPIASGGIPPSVGDMNGILKMTTAHIAFLQSGAGYLYNSTIATAIGGYNLGAMLLAADGSGYWLNLLANNTSNPDTGGSYWGPMSQYGVGILSGLAGSTVALSAAQYGKSVIVLQGALTANIIVEFPPLAAQWVVVNQTTGAFAVTCKTFSGTGVVVPQGSWSAATTLQGDGFNIYTQAGSFVTSAGLAASLASYVLSSTLAATLSGYVTNASLASQLSVYTSINYLENTVLPAYPYTSYVVANFVSNASLATQLAAYLSVGTAASTYTSIALLNTTLSSYITASALNARLGSANIAQGWEFSPNGVLRQWGIATGAASSPGATITFNKPYPNACQKVTATAYTTNATVSVLSYNQTGFQLINGSGSECTWDATGY